MNKLCIISVLLGLSILVVPLLAAFIFKRKANKLREQKPVWFIIYNLLIFFSPLILLDIYFFLLLENWVSIKHPYYFFIACLAAIFVIRFLIIEKEWLQMKQMTQKNKELAKIHSIFATGSILTLVYPIIFAGEAAIKVYLLALLILIYWIYAIFTIIVVSKRIHGEVND